MSMTPHPSFEDLSAYHDGEAPEWAAHVAACVECRRRLDQLAALTAAVARPLEAPAVGEVAGEVAVEVAGDPVARALAAVDEADRAVAGPRGPVAPPAPARPARGRWLPWITAASAAAVLVLVFGVLAVVNRSDRNGTAGSALTEGDRPTAVSGPPPADQAAPTPGPPRAAAAGGDLGDIADARTLLARVRPAVDGAPEAAAAPRVVGTYPCETEARAADPSLGPVVYHGTARVQGTPAVVLGFTPPGQPGPLTVQARALADCRLLLSASSP
ncbi:MAG TPA: hypothetical protein VHF24_11055 [Acidimicrobiales bacterium]|nr:hypothetical protein [Acidimicrobiales bacterium]